MLRGIRGRRTELLAVGGLFAVTALYLVWNAARVHSYIWLVDEFLYTKAAQGFASGSLHPQVFSVHTPVPNVLYALILALPYWLLSNLHAFTVAHVFGALAFASSVVPIYLTARFVGARFWWAVFGAALGTWIPWAVAVNVLMSEALAYPLFAWAVLATIYAVSVPRPRNDVLAIVAIGVAGLARTQLLVLAPVLVIAIALHEAGWRAPDASAEAASLGGDDASSATADWRGRLRAHWVVGAALLIALIAVAIGGSNVVGRSYAFTTNYARFPGGLASSMADHLAHVIVGLGVIPAVLWGVAVIRGGTAPRWRAEHVFALVSGLTMILLLYQAGFFAQQIAGGQLQERYVFYIAAPIVVGAAVALSDRTRVQGVIAPIVVGLIAALIVGMGGYEVGRDTFRTLLAAASGYNGTLADAIHSVRSAWTIQGGLAFATVVLGLITAIVFAIPRVRRIGAPVLAGLALLFCIAETQHDMKFVVHGINTAYPSELATAPKAWVDGLLYKGDMNAAALELARDSAESDVWTWTEFWNSRITRRYQLPNRPQSADQLPRTPMTFDPRSGRLITTPELPALVLNGGDQTLSIRGRLVRQTAVQQQLLLPEHPYRAAWAYGQATGDNRLLASPVDLSVYRPNAGARVATVSFTIGAAAKAGRWTARSGAVARHGNASAAAPAKVQLTLRPKPGARRAVVALSGPADGRLTISAIRVRWQ